MNAQGQLRETFTRGVGLAGDPAVAGLVAVTHHAGSWTNGTFYIHHNHRGDPAMRGILTRSGTTTVGSYDYSVPRSRDNLQSQIGPDVCRFKFSSKERDVSTGFYYYGYRFYAPQRQRWISRDPIGEIGGFNLYTFVENDPVNGLDELGLVSCGSYVTCFASCMILCMLGFDELPTSPWLGPPPFAAGGVLILSWYETATMKCPKGPEGKLCRELRKFAQKNLKRLLIEFGVKGGLRIAPIVGWALIAVDASLCGFKCHERCKSR